MLLEIENIKFDKSKVLTRKKYRTKNYKKLFFFSVHRVDKSGLGGATNEGVPLTTPDGNIVIIAT